MKIAVLGAGQMGSAFGAPALERGHELRYWGPGWIDGLALEALAAGAPHPDLKTALPSPVETTTEIAEAVRDAEIVALAVTSEGAEWVSEEAAETVPEDIPILVFTKGLVERGGEIVPAAVRVREIFGPSHPVVVVGGPVKVVRYHPGYWAAVVGRAKGDSIAPVLSAAVAAVEERYPALILEAIGG